ncbi:hypothetical protein J4465_03285 [Candidatus Pacearchaeota archaeon]|nr:hypothetical protein [Candidatus Pacearchaeota archaeon]
MDEKVLRESFEKIKEDMLFLSREILDLKEELIKISQTLSEINVNKDSTKNQQIQHISSTNSKVYGGIKPYFRESKGNDGVPADSQQTVSTYPAQLKRTFNMGGQTIDKTRILQKIQEEIMGEKNKEEIESKNNMELKQLSDLVSNLKKELKDKFKGLSKQEFSIFSALYSLEEQSKEISYKDLAISTGLTESSIRDYISRLIHKGIPIIKEKVNNKTVMLRISPELRNISTLDILSRINSRQIN